VLRRLWGLAEHYTPAHRTAAYNQAMMDMGSMVCLQRAPDCPACPLQTSCQGLAQGRTLELPTPKPKKTLPVRSSTLMVVRDLADAVLLERRPPMGVWGGLWSFPECSPAQNPSDWCWQHFACSPDAINPLPSRRHSFSHFHLDITPLEIRVNNPNNRVMDEDARVWYNLTRPDARGLAAPVSRILDELVTNAMGENE